MTMPVSPVRRSAPPGLPDTSPTLNEVSGLMRKRLAWYGLEHLNLRRLEVDEDGDIVAELSDSLTTVTYEEVFDHRTGSRRSRTARRCRAA